MRPFAIIACMTLLAFAFVRPTSAQPPPPATAPVGPLAHLSVDVHKRQIRADCQALACAAPLEFFCVVNGGNEHESVLKSPVKPSDLHFALLMLGLKPGEPVHYSQSTNTWTPPHGPPLHISVEFQKDGRTVTCPAYRLMRNILTKKEMPPITWIFAGSRIMDDGSYAADATGYLVSIVNFDLTPIDVPQLASSANETLEWEVNFDLLPKLGTPMTMIIEPAGDSSATAAAAAPPNATAPVDVSLITVDAAGNVQLDHHDVAMAELTPSKLAQLSSQKPLRIVLASADVAGPAAPLIAAATPLKIPVEIAAPATQPVLSDVHIDQAQVDRMQALWDRAVEPHRQALREAAQAHEQVIKQLRNEQQRLIDEADRIQRKIDELEKEYQDMTTPQPEQ